jgi:hypothetical protein
MRATPKQSEQLKKFKESAQSRLHFVAESGWSRHVSAGFLSDLNRRELAALVEWLDCDWFCEHKQHSKSLAGLRATPANR